MSTPALRRRARPQLLATTAVVVPVDASAPVGAVADPTSTVFINELHYDNIGTDAGEAVEVAAPAGTDLTGWTIVPYNGNGGTPYATDGTLAGVVADQGGGYGTLSRGRRRACRTVRPTGWPSSIRAGRSSSSSATRASFTGRRRSGQRPDVDGHRRRPGRHRAGRLARSR